MIAALGMYDPRWLHRANERLWSALAGHLREAGITDVPAMLCRSRPLAAVWTDPALILAQTCGYPLMTRLGDAVSVVATPVYHAPGCEGAWHRSAIVVRADDRAADLPVLAGRIAAINSPDSNTGMNLLRAAIAPHARNGRFFGGVITTGAHARSAFAVVAGRADVAAIDAVTWALLTDRYPALARRLRVLAWTAATPGLPLITARGRDPAPLRAALQAVIADPALADARAALRLADIAVLDREEYGVILALERAAIDAGYPVLA